MTTPRPDPQLALTGDELEAGDAATIETHGPDASSSREGVDHRTERFSLSRPSRFQEPSAEVRSVPVIPGYIVEAEAGRGGHGVVYRARDEVLGRTVALKVLRHGAFATDSERERFLAEARAVARLEHPGVVRVWAAGEHVDLPYLVAEWMPGGPLSARLDGTPLPEPDAVGLVETLARAAHHAHCSGVVHRDIKPSNVLLPGAGFHTPKLSDFGQAKFNEPTGDPTPTQAVLGTPSYMAPEQAMGTSRQAGPAADVYSLGAVLFELLTGRPPFRGATPFETMIQVRDHDPIRPREFRPGLARDLETICLRCLEKDPRARYATAADLADDLARFRAGRPVLTRPIGPLARFVRWGRRNPATARWVALLGLVVISSVAALATLWRRAEAAAERATAKAEESDRRQKTSREALRMYTAAAVPLFKNPSAAGAKERESLARALELYEQVLEESVGDPDEQHRAAYATLQLADGLRHIGESEASVRACNRAVETLRRLVEEHPGERRYRYDYSQGCAQLGGTLKDLGPVEEPIRWLREAISAGEVLVEQHPDRDAYPGSLASYRTNLAGILLQLGRPAEAEPLYQAAAPITTALVEKYPHDPMRYCYHTTTLHGWAKCRLALGDPAGFVRIANDLIDRIERVRATRADDWWLMLLEACPPFEHLAQVLEQSGRHGEACEALNRGVRLWREARTMSPAETRIAETCDLLEGEYAHLVWTGDRIAGSQLFRRNAASRQKTAEETGLPRLWMRLALFLATCPDPAVRDPIRALDLARTAAADRLCPRELLWVHGACLLEAGEVSAAIGELEEAERLSPTSPDYRSKGCKAMAVWLSGRQDAGESRLKAWDAAIAATPLASFATRNHAARYRGRVAQP